MLAFERLPLEIITSSGKQIHVFETDGQNIDKNTVESFGEEWQKFNSFTDEEILKAGNQYFDIIPDEYVRNKYILDVGCGSGRWSKYLATKAGFIECIDPSDAVYTAAQFLKSYSNVRISRASVDSIPFPDNYFDFVFSLGVLHHIPDTTEAMKNCVKKLKPHGYFMVYLYYNLDNRGWVFRMLFVVSNIFRLLISRLPSSLKRTVCDIIAVLVYGPLTLISKLLKKIGLQRFAKKIPLSYYADHSFNIIRNDSLDRFGTPLEQRFSKKEIEKMMENCGLKNIVFSDSEPYWHAVGQKL